MTVNLVKGNNSSSAVLLQNKLSENAPNVNNPTNAARPDEAIKQVRDAGQQQGLQTSTFQAQASLNSDAVLNNVRASFRVERNQQRLRDPKEATQLAHNIAAKIKGDNAPEALDAHDQLEPLNSGRHFLAN